MSHHPPVQTVQEGDVTTIVLDAPERSNLLTVEAMDHVLAGLEAAHEARSVLLRIRATGADFCLGRDQSERRPDVTRRESLDRILRANALLREFPGLTLTQVQGRAFGFGAGLAAQSDLALAAEDATFAFDEVLHGLAPLVVAEYLPGVVGPTLAADLILTGQSITAQTALGSGLVSRLVAADRLEEAADGLAAHLLRLEPGALRLMKRYQLQLAAGALEDPRVSAVEQLDAWIAAGRRAFPA